MVFRWWLLLLIVIFWMPAFAGMTSSQAANITDDIGANISLAKPATRIVSLAPDITEILFAIGVGNHIVGVISGSDSPLPAKKITQVGSYSGLDIEKIMALHPDLIVTWGHTFSRPLSVFQKLHIPVYTTNPHQLQDIPRTMQSLGRLAGVEKQAQAAAKSFNQRLAQLRQQYQSAKPITVFYQIGAYGLITINKESWINQIITLCGGQNVFANAKTTAPEVSWEAVLAANPQVVIAGVENPTWRERWQQWPAISAVKQHALFTINPDLVERAGPRILEGTLKVCEALEVGRLRQ